MERNVSGLSRCRQRPRQLIPLVLFILSTTHSLSQANTFTGRVERVIDGDTIVVRVSPTVPAPSNSTQRARSPACHASQGSRGLLRVRLAEIDAPELRTDFGPAAKRALEKMIAGKTVVVKWSKRGRYRRIIGTVFVGDRNICHYLVVNGFARRYARTPKKSIVAALEAKARKADKGLWTTTLE